MTKQRFASQNSILEWASINTCDYIGTVVVVPKDGLYYYFSLDDKNYYNLVMSSEKNLAEE